VRRRTPPVSAVHTQPVGCGARCAGRSERVARQSASRSASYVRHEALRPAGGGGRGLRARQQQRCRLSDQAASLVFWHSPCCIVVPPIYTLPGRVPTT
jgi:hypothetical protein